MTPEQYCEQKAAPRGSSLHYALLQVQGPRRAALLALHAWRREVTDIATELSDHAVALQKLGWWVQELDRCFAGRPQHPVTQALAPHVESFGLTREPFIHALSGVEFDLRQNRYLDYALLQRQCEQVAGSIGQVAARILGATSPPVLQHAQRLGLALQLIAQIRDVGHHARRGRVTLPLEDLQRFDVKLGDLLDGKYVAGFGPLMQFQTQRARVTLAEALALLPAAEAAAQRPARVLAALYAALLAEIERSDFQVLQQRIALTPLRKLWIAWRT
jgi:phytoene synthase